KRWIMVRIDIDRGVSMLRPGASGLFDRRWVVALVVVLLVGRASAQEFRDKPSVSATIDRGLAFLAKDALAWKKEHNCTSCHHASMVIWSMQEARQRGH